MVIRLKHWWKLCEILKLNLIRGTAPEIIWTIRPITVTDQCKERRSYQFCPEPRPFCLNSIHAVIGYSSTQKPAFSSLPQSSLVAHPLLRVNLEKHTFRTSFSCCFCASFFTVSFFWWDYKQRRVQLCMSKVEIDGGSLFMFTRSGNRAARAV